MALKTNSMETRFTFTDKDTGEVVEVAPERWVWGVIYRPTEAQINASRIATEARDKVLIEERDKRLADMRARGVDTKDIATLEGEFDVLMMRPAGLVCDELHQFASDGSFHQIGEVDQERVQLASLYYFDDYDMKKRIDIPFRPGMKLIHKYRNIKPAGHKEFIKCYMFGYKYEGQTSLFFVLPDDRIIVAPADDVDLTMFDLQPLKKE